MANRQLAQWEIDALLNAIGGAESEQAPAAPEKSVKLYDFRRPDRFSKDHIRALQALSETYCRVVGSILSSYLRTVVTVHLATVEQAVFDDYLAQLPTPTLLSLVDMAPLPGRAIIEMNMDIGLVLLDRVLGGPGRVTKKDRELTEIEFNLAKGLAAQLVRALNDTWSELLDLHASLEDLVLSPQFVQAAYPGDMAVMFIFEVQAAEASGTMTMCLAHSVLEPIMSSLASQMWHSSGPAVADRAQQPGLDRQLRGVRVPALVELGRTRVTVRDLLHLRLGDVIRLDARVDGDLPLIVGPTAKFACRPGLSGRNLAVRVTRVLAEEEEA